MKFLCNRVLIVLLLLLPAFRGEAQVLTLITGAAKKVIKAIDLQIQRIQNKTIGLQNVQKQLENKLSELKLTEISDWTKRQKEIYQEYFDELWKVKTVIAYYKRITEVIEKQKELIDEYKEAYALVSSDQHFSPKELEYIYQVYSGIIAESLNSVDQIIALVQSFTVQMSDADRLAIINNSAEQIEEHISDMRAFSRQNIQLSLQRTKDMEELATIRRLYGIQ